MYVRFACDALLNGCILTSLSATVKKREREENGKKTSERWDLNVPFIPTTATAFATKIPLLNTLKLYHL